LLCVLLLAGCMPQQSARQSYAPPGPIDPASVMNPEPPIAQSLGAVSALALEAPDMRRIVVGGLEYLAAVTPDLSAEVNDDTIVLKFADHPAITFAAKPGQPVSEWTREATKMLRLVTAQGAGYAQAVPKRTIVLFLAGGLAATGTALDVAVADSAPRAVPGLVFASAADKRLRLCMVFEPVRLAEVGIPIGAELTEVEGHAINGASLAGPPGTTVQLTFRDHQTSKTVEVPRGFHDDGEFRRIGTRRDVVYARPATLRDGVATRTVSSIKRVSDEIGSPRAIVLDLRCHPGGVVAEAAMLASAFLDGGVIGFAEGRHRASNQTFSTTAGDKLAKVPVVVLVNGGTTSGAEWLAAALKDNDRALVVGSTTGGVSGIMRVVPIKDIGSLRITWAKLLTPKRASFDGVGIVPDLCVDTDDIGQAEPRALRKATCERWVAHDGLELSYVEQLIDDPQAPPLMSLRTAAGAPAL
jgi:carboxyl-terminal processing protease